MTDAPPATPKQKPVGRMSPRRYAIFMGATLTLIFIATNILFGSVLRGARLDLTADRLYSLSDGTTTILRDLAEPIDLTLYYSADASADDPVMRGYSARVRELLQSYVARARGKIRLREVNPLRFTEAEDEADAAGIQAVAREGADPLYFGLAGANAADERVAIPHMAPEREAYLEYEITRMISELEQPRKLKLALITSLPLDPMLARLPPELTGGQSQPLFFAELMRVADVRMIPRGFTSLPADVDELIILQPWQLSAQEYYAVDQFLMAKGRAFIAVDPAALSWGGASQFAPSTVEVSASMDGLFSKWGVTVSDNIVLDGKGALEVQTTDPQGREIVLPQPLYVGVPADQLSREDLVTAGLNRAIYFAGAGAITWTPADGVVVTPLARSSDATVRLPAEEALIGASPIDLLQLFMVQQPPKAETFAVRVSGTLGSAFGNVKPANIVAAPNAKHLAKSARAAEIVVVADADFLNDGFYVGQNRTPFVDNGAFALNAIDLLAGSDALVSLRSRAPSMRRLEVLDDMRRGAQERMRQSEDKLRAEMERTEQRLAELQDKGRGSGFFSGDLGAEMTPEESREIDELSVRLAKVRGELRNVERVYRADVDKLQGWLVLLNVGIAPLLIAAAGLFLFWRRQNRGSRGAVATPAVGEKP